ncbi:hypothetical protein [Myxosarcina sp. GI1]|uniref:hypothetical protein n=1 Tax=Myxosarcina sp. GI1 TaxID=1541065 RepID=UPI0005651EB2|nr:hypothetical protein [Myxosarcina sp. GI1]
MTQKLLMVEIRTLQNPDIDIETLPTITIYHDSQDNYFMSSGIEEIKNAVEGMMPHLGTNCRQSLFFAVEIVRGNELYAFLDSLSSFKGRKRASKFGNHS